MAIKTRPRWDEFLLALFWTMAGLILLYFGIIGYVANLAAFTDLQFSLPRFVISFVLICLAVFGLNYAFQVLGRLPKQLPTWLDNSSTLFLGSVLLVGFGFSLFTIGVVIYYLFNNETDRLVLAWGVATTACLTVLAIYQLLWSLNTFEPFLPWPDQFYNQTTLAKTNPLMRLLLGLNSIQHSLLGRLGKVGYAPENISGPLLPEPDPKTTVVEEKPDGRPGLEKSMIAHGGWHASTLGFTANGTVIFALSNGGTIHYKAGGRKGMLFPPEIKFWELHSDKVQTASLGQPYVFLTRNYEAPAPIQNYRFIVPNGGGKFALVTPRLLRVGEWQSHDTQNYNPEEPITLQGFNGFVPLTFNPEGSKIGWCNAEGQTYVWNTEDNQVQTLRRYPAKDGSMTGQEDGTWGLVFSPDGTKIATLGAQGVLLQNVYTGWRWFAQNDPIKAQLTAFAFNYNGFEMAVGLNAEANTVKFSISNRNRYHNGSFNLNEILPAEPYGLNREVEQTRRLNVVRIWDLRLPDFIDLLAGTEPLREIVFSPDNQMLAAVDEAGLLRLWDIPVEGLGGRPAQLVAQVDVGLSGRKTVLNFSPDMQRLACTTDNRVLIYNLARLRREAMAEPYRQPDSSSY